MYYIDMEKYLTYAMDIGEQLLLNGAEIYRVEESVRRMCYALGASRVDIFIITSSMVLTVYTEEKHAYTQTRRISTSYTDFEKIHQLNDLVRKFCDGCVPPDEIPDRLASIKEIKSYPVGLVCLAYASIAGAFTLFFGGGFKETLISLIIGGIICFVVRFSEKTVSNRIFPKFFSSVIVTFLSMASFKLGLIPNIDKVIIGNIMTLIPGIGLTNALRDLFVGDSIAGLLRAMEAMIIALSISAGYFVVAVLWGF